MKFIISFSQGFFWPELFKIFWLTVQGSEEGNEDCKNKPSAPLFKGPTDQIDGKRYNVAKAESRLLWRPKFTNFSSFMDKTYVHEMKVPLIDYNV